MEVTVTVLTATWNRAPFLEGMVRSAKEQRYQDWEHIVVNDGSTDDTAARLAQLSHLRLKIIYTENRGQAEALNLAISQAKGDWLAFLDSDDEYLPDHLANLLAESADMDLLLARFELVNCTKDPEPRVRDFYRPGQEIAVKDIEVITGALFVRTELARKIGGFRNVPSTDTDFFNRALKAGARWRRLSTPTYRYFFGRDLKNSMALRDLASDKKPG